MTGAKEFSAVINVTGRARVFVMAHSAGEAQQKILSGEWDEDELIEWEGDLDPSRPPKVEEN